MFISFEGCEGAGKTTLSIFLQQQISLYYQVLLTKEPGGMCDFNIKMKDFLLKFYDKIDIYTEALLYAADRTEHLQKTIIPALNQKKIVICDRYVDSSLVYQSYARGLEEDFIKQINKKAFQTLPDITFYLDLDPQIGLQRIRKNRKDKIESFDLKNINFHNKIRAGYLKLCAEYPERIYKLDAAASLKSLSAMIIKQVQKCFSIKI